MWWHDLQVASPVASLAPSLPTSASATQSHAEPVSSLTSGLLNTHFPVLRKPLPSQVSAEMPPSPESPSRPLQTEYLFHRLDYEPFIGDSNFLL